MGAFSCLCLPVAKSLPDVDGELELKTACERATAPKITIESERPLTYADLCGPSKGNALSPFEAALAARGTSAPKLSFQRASPSPYLSPFDSVKSFPTFLSAASYPSSVESDAAPAPPPMRASTVSPLESALGHFDLDRVDTANLHDLSSSNPPSPKTPLQGESFSKGVSWHGDKLRSTSEALHSSNPLKGHPRYRKLKQLQGRGRCRSSRSGAPLTLLCKDEDTGQLAVISFLHRGTAHVRACMTDILNMRACNAHPFIMHLHQAFVTRKYLAVVTEHGPSGILSDYILEHSLDSAGRALREDVARSLFQQLMVAVEFCHAMDIRIGDLRPHNMLLLEHNDLPSLCSIASTGDPCVLPEGGLGLGGVPRLKLMLTQMEQDPPAASLEDSASPMYSTAVYSAPEVAAGLAHYDAAAADVYSCGVLLHHMLTGELPFHPEGHNNPSASPEPASSLQADQHRRLRLEGVPPGCQDLLTRMLQADPENRPTAGDVMRHPWFQIDCPEGLEDVNTELIIMDEEGLTESFSPQGERELRATLERACQVRTPSAGSFPRSLDNPEN